MSAKGQQQMPTTKTSHSTGSSVQLTGRSKPQEKGPSDSFNANKLAVPAPVKRDRGPKQNFSLRSTIPPLGDY